MLTVMFSVGINLYYPKRFEREINAAARVHGVEPALIAAVARVESGFDASALSAKGAVGVMQVMPSTARWLSVKRGMPVPDLRDARQNIDFGSYYLKYLLVRFGTTELALAAYNAGEGNVSAWLNAGKITERDLSGIPFSETRVYIKRVCAAYRAYAHSWDN